MTHLKIKEYLAKNGIKQTYLAEQMSISRASLGERLNGKTKLTVEEYFLICSILGVPLDLFKAVGGAKAS